MKQRYLFLTFLALILGILIGAFVSFKFVVALILFTVTVVCFIFYKRLGFYGILTLIIVAGIVITGISFKSYESCYNNTTLSGTVKSIEAQDNGYIIYLESCDFSITKETESLSVRAYVSDNSLPLKEGYKISAYGDAKPVLFKKHANIGGINPWLSSMTDGVYYYFYAENISVEDATADLNYYFSLLKQRIRQIIFKNVNDSDSAAVLYAMLTGDRSYISSEVSSLFSACGTSHLLAVSGLHVSILINLIYFCLRRLRLNNAVSLIVIAVFVVTYALFTGLSPSVLRASVMAITLAFASTLSNRYDSVNALGLAGIFILIINPFILFDIAFQLSFCACFGIMVFTRYQISSKSKVLNFIVNSCLITLGATLFTLPLQIYYFGATSIISIFANILFVSMASCGLMVCFIFTLLSFLWHGFGFFTKLAGIILEGVIFASRIFAKVPLLYFKPIEAIYVILITALLIFFTRFIRVKKKLFACLLLIVFTLCSVGINFYIYNFIKIRVPYIEKDTLLVHIEGRDTYVCGLSENTNYLLRNTKTIDYLFLITEDDVDNLEFLNENVKAENIFVAPNIPLTKRASSLNAKHLEDSLTLKDGTFCFSENGLIFINGENKIFIGSGARNEFYTLAITNDSLVRAKTVITNGEPHTFNKEFYDIKYNGYTSITLRRYNEPY